MWLAILLAVLPQDLRSLTSELAEPTAPDARWERQEPAPIEGSEAFETFADAFTAETAHAWAGSPRARAYDLQAELPESWSVGELQEQLLILARRVRVTPTFTAHNGELLRSALERELERLFTAIASVAGEVGLETTLEWDHVSEVVDERFQPAHWSHRDDEGTLVTDTLFFPGEPSQVILRLDRAAGGLGGSTPFAYFATLDQAVEFRAVCARVTALFSVVVGAQLERTALRLREIDAGWTNYLEHGFSQYPWESWANGWLTDFAWTRPPRDQWVLLHPELGFVFDTRSSRSAQMEAALLVHGVGYVRYFGDTRDWFAGLSATASITGDSAYGLGFGPTLHFGHARIASRVPHVSVSVLWQDFEVGGRDPVLAATLDLWRLVDRGSEALYEARLLRR